MLKRLYEVIILVDDDDGRIWQEVTQLEDGAVVDRLIGFDPTGELYAAIGAALTAGVDSF